MKTHTLWKTIEIGTKEPKFSKDIIISSYAKDLLSKTTYPKKKENIDLVILTPKDLGLTNYCTTTQLFDEANLAKYGVELCPAYVAPFLRQEYMNQPNGELLYIAMNPIAASDDDPSVFGVGRDGDGGLWLLGRWAFPGVVWNLDYRIVFRLRKVSQSSDFESSDMPLESFPSVLPAETSVEAVSKKLEQAITQTEELLKTLQSLK